MKLNIKLTQTSILDGGRYAQTRQDFRWAKTLELDSTSLGELRARTGVVTVRGRAHKPTIGNLAVDTQEVSGSIEYAHGAGEDQDAIIDFRPDGWQLSDVFRKGFTVAAYEGAHLELEAGFKVHYEGGVQHSTTENLKIAPHLMSVEFWVRKPEGGRYLISTSKQLSSLFEEYELMDQDALAQTEAAEELPTEERVQAWLLRKIYAETLGPGLEALWSNTRDVIQVWLNKPLESLVPNTKP
jgi:hypothetical protein